jgi:hypothetical protein
MTSGGSWTCPLCGARAESGAEHLRGEHGIGRSSEDRLGLRATLRGRAAPRDTSAEPPPLRIVPRRRRRVPSEGVEGPPEPRPIPPDAGVLRLVCETLEGVDLADLQGRLADLSGVESVTVDLYDRMVDLFLDRRRAAPPHLVALATERVGLPVTAAELHRTPPAGAKLGEETLLFVLA